MIDEARDGPASGVDDHVLIEAHEVVALSRLVSLTLHDRSITVTPATNLVVLVLLVHSSIALLLGDDLARVLENDLMRLERAVAAHTIPTVCRLDHIDANVVLAPCLVPPP